MKRGFGTWRLGGPLRLQAQSAHMSSILFGDAMVPNIE